MGGKNHTLCKNFQLLLKKHKQAPYFHLSTGSTTHHQYESGGGVLVQLINQFINFTDLFVRPVRLFNTVGMDKTACCTCGFSPPDHIRLVSVLFSRAGQNQIHTAHTTWFSKAWQKFLANIWWTTWETFPVEHKMVPSADENPRNQLASQCLGTSRAISMGHHQLYKK